jgi:hypothetical protein
VFNKCYFEAELDLSESVLNESYMALDLCHECDGLGPSGGPIIFYVYILLSPMAQPGLASMWNGDKH